MILLAFPLSLLVLVLSCVFMNKIFDHAFKKRFMDECVEIVQEHGADKQLARDYCESFYNQMRGI